MYILTSTVLPLPLAAANFKCWQPAIFVNQWPFYESLLCSNIVAQGTQDTSNQTFSKKNRGFVILPVWAKFGTDLECFVLF